MKKLYFLIITCILLVIQVSAQSGIVEYDLPTRDGHAKAGQAVLQETAANIEVKMGEAYGRIGYVEFAVNEIVAASKVEFEIEYYYTNKGALEVPVKFDIMNGPLAADISWDNQPDDANFTLIAENQVFNSDNKGVVSYDITEFYNTALADGQSHIGIRFQATDTDALLRFYSSKKSGNEPKLKIESNCPRYFIEVDTLVCEGSTIQIGDITVSEDGAYNDTLTTVCGADSVRVYHTLFIKNETITIDTTFCSGGVFTIQTGPRTSQDYTEAGQFTEVMTNGTCTQTTVINITLWDLPVPQDLGDDVEINEGNNLILDAGSGFTAYQWFNDGKEAGTGQTLDVNLEADAFHTGINEIEVFVTDVNGCIGSDDVWVTIKGNLFLATKDCFIEQAGDRLVDIARIEVKNDLYGDQNTPKGEGPFYSKELFLAFDLTEAEIPDDIANVRLRLYLYGITNAPDVTDTVDLSIDCHYMDGIYGDDITWSTLPATGLRTQMSQSTVVNSRMINSYIEWNINDIFMNEILGQKNQFSIILTSYTDMNSTLAKFRDINNNNPDVRPSIVYDVGSTGTENLELEMGDVNFYPNPTNEKLYFTHSEDFDELEVYDLTGKQVLFERVDSNFVNVSALEAGVYIIRLKNQKQNINKLFVKE